MRLLRIIIRKLFKLIWIAFKRWYNLCIRGLAMDADEAKAITTYFLKVINDPKYQPQTAQEKEFEQRLIDAHSRVLKEHPEFDPKDYPYDECRAEYAAEVLYQMVEYTKIKDKN